MCKTPLNVKVQRSDGWRTIPVPCGKCKRCIAQRVASWQWRMEQELRVSTTPYFVTLTYNRKSCPIADVPWGDSTRKFRVLRPRDMTLYLKSLRFHYAKQSDNLIRYFYVGEYGTLRKRPHYHLILLNCDDVRLIQDTWKHGFVDISPINSMDNSIAYCLAYLYKRNTFAPPNHPQFSRMSKGLGRSYISKEVINYHNRKLDNSSVTMSNGRRIPLPKYMKERIYTEENRFLLSHHLQVAADVALDKKVKSVMRSTGLSEESVLHQFFMEPYISPPKRPKASLM